MKPEQEDKLLLQLIIQSLEKLDERLAQATEDTKNSINDLDQKVNGINITMARNTESLEAHMMRTELLEEALKPIKVTHDGISVTGKIIALIALGVTIIGGIWTTFKVIIGAR
jgi:uncharacterized protein YlxW (UPF0749 family)